MTTTHSQTLGIYCVFALFALARMHTGNLLVRLGVALIVFFAIPGVVYALASRGKKVPQA